MEILIGIEETKRNVNYKNITWVGFYNIAPSSFQNTGSVATFSLEIELYAQIFKSPEGSKYPIRILYIFPRSADIADLEEVENKLKARGIVLVKE